MLCLTHFNVLIHFAIGFNETVALPDSLLSSI